MLVILLLAAIGGLVHPVLAALLAAPVYFRARLVLYVVMFGVMYFMWRAVCGEGWDAPPLPPDRAYLLPFPANDHRNNRLTARTHRHGRPPSRRAIGRASCRERQYQVMF